VIEDRPRVDGRVVVALSAVYVIWGSTYLALRYVVEALPGLLTAAVRNLAAGAILYAVARARGAAAPTTRQWLFALPTGALLFLFGNGFVSLAEQTVPSGLAAVACAATPLFACAMTVPLGERHTRLEWAGVALGFAGVVLLALGDLRAARGSGTLLLLAPLGWALGSVLSRRLAMPAGAMCAASQMLGGGAVTLVAALAHGDRWPPALGGTAQISLVYLVLFGSLTGFSAYSYLLRHTTTALATSYAYVNPVLAVLLGAALGGERPDARLLVPAALVIGGVGILVSGRALTPARGVGRRGSG
jgi:drug/metabolite transporter (DMT)-like permease